MRHIQSSYKQSMADSNLAIRPDLPEYSVWGAQSCQFNHCIRNHCLQSLYSSPLRSHASHLTIFNPIPRSRSHYIIVIRICQSNQYRRDDSYICYCQLCFRYQISSVTPRMRYNVRLNHCLGLDMFAWTRMGYCGAGD